VFFGIATSGGTLAYQKMAPTRQAADKLVDDRLAAPFNADANDFIYQWDASRDFNASPGLERIKARLLAINAADDERNPPETGIMEREIKRVAKGRAVVIPLSDKTRGHGSHTIAALWKSELERLLKESAK
jgi:homoserine O-acetyltransferase